MVLSELVPSTQLQKVQLLICEARRKTVYNMGVTWLDPCKIRNNVSQIFPDMEELLLLLLRRITYTEVK